MLKKITKRAIVSAFILYLYNSYFNFNGIISINIYSLSSIFILGVSGLLLLVVFYLFL